MTTRQDFIGATAIFAAALPQVTLAAVPPNPASLIPDLQFDVAAFNGLLDRNVEHKHLFSARKIEAGSAFDGIRNTLDAYRDINVPFANVSSVAVFYHGISPLMAFDDSVWNRHIPTMIEKGAGKPWVDDLKSAAAIGKGNPFAQTIRAIASDSSIHLFVCNNAMRGLSSLLASWTGKTDGETYNNLVAHLLPHASLVPAGVWAVHAIQQRGFTLLQTS